MINFINFYLIFNFIKYFMYYLYCCIMFTLVKKYFKIFR